MAHLRPLENSEINDGFIKDRFAHYEATRGFIPNSIRTMARRPNIVKAFMALNQAVLYEGSVSEDLKMLISLMCSFSAGCLYCQSHMANLSNIYNASEEKIAALMEYETSNLFTDAERAALSLAYKAAQVPNDTSQKDFDMLSQYFDDGQIVEIIASIGLFGYLNRWNDTMATTLEPVANARAQNLIGPQGWAPGKHTPKS